MKPQAFDSGGRMNRWFGVMTSLILFFLALTVAGYYVKKTLSDPEKFPITEVQIKGSLRYIKASAVQELVTTSLVGSFFTINVSRLREELELIPGVRAVEVRRLWPDQLIIRVQEYEAIAIWHEAGQTPALMSAEGIIFSPKDNIEAFSSLPKMQGASSSSTMVLAIYQDAVSLLETYGLEIKKIQLDERYAWTLTLSNGDRLHLGRQSFFLRLGRFLNVYEQHLKYLENGGNREIDLRYTNGFAVKVGLSLNS